MIKIITIYILILTALNSNEPISPIPLKVDFDKEKAKLGYYLFNELKLSRDKTVSCSTCHLLGAGGADVTPKSFGIYRTKTAMNTPTVLNSMFNFRQFWNGRAKDLRQQAVDVIHNPREMGMNVTLVEQRLNLDEFYKRLFKDTYKKSFVHFDDVIDAIVEFEKSLFTPNSRFDNYLRGYKEALSKEELEGYKLFKIFGCIMCHNGINVGGNSYQKMGTVIPFTNDENKHFNDNNSSRPNSGAYTTDMHHSEDRFQITGKVYDKNVYKVPSLRNIELTAPYLHTGELLTLKEMIVDMGYHNLGVHIGDEDSSKIEAFLKTLTGETPKFLRDFGN